MKLNVAIIGSGKSASEQHIPAYGRVRETHVVAIADSDPDEARSVAKRFGISGVYDDYVVMLKRRHPDLVSVCTPPSEHKDAVLFALSRGSHVLCDMPMATSAEEGTAMLEAAREADRVLVFAAPRRFEVQATSVKQAIVNRDLGAICFCSAWRWQKAIPADDLWKIKAKDGGGVLSVFGQEMLDLALWLIGDEPVSVSGQLFHRFSGNPDIPKTWFGSRRELDAEDLAVALVRCQTSLISLEVDWLSSTDDSGIQIVGTKGRARTSPLQMEVTSRGQFADMTPTFFPATQAWDEQVRSLIEASLGHQKPFPDVEETLRVQQICDAIYKSSRSGRDVPLSGT